MRRAVQPHSSQPSPQIKIREIQNWLIATCENPSRDTLSYNQKSRGSGQFKLSRIDPSRHTVLPIINSFDLWLLNKRTLIKMQFGTDSLAWLCHSIMSVLSHGRPLPFIRFRINVRLIMHMCVEEVKSNRIQVPMRLLRYARSFARSVLTSACWLRAEKGVPHLVLPFKTFNDSSRLRLWHQMTIFVSLTITDCG